MIMVNNEKAGNLDSSPEPRQRKKPVSGTRLFSLKSNLNKLQVLSVVITATASYPLFQAFQDNPLILIVLVGLAVSMIISPCLFKSPLAAIGLIVFIGNGFLFGLFALFQLYRIITAIMAIIEPFLNNLFN
jgi:hypothetical protein